jgi:hypothetical protein
MFYIIRGEVYLPAEHTNETLEIFEEFHDSNPIFARTKAFIYYQNYIDIFLESKAKKYLSHEQAEVDLQDFFNSQNRSKELKNPEFGDYGMCIQISFVYDDSIVHTLKNGINIYKGEEVIHGIHNKKEDLRKIYLRNLKLEFNYYKKHNYDFENYKKALDVSELFEEKK